LAENAPAATDRATFRTFDGQVLQFAGRKEGGKAYITVTASRDAALAEKFAEAAPASTAGAAVTPASGANTTAGKPADQTAERLAARAGGIEYEIPLYKYDSLFKPQEQLLEPKGK
jgi:hypothetical protein